MAIHNTVCCNEGDLTNERKLAPMSDTQAFAAWLAPVTEAEWVVYAKPPSAEPCRYSTIWAAIPTGSRSPTTG
jgi:hypothetical protein